MNTINMKSLSACISSFPLVAVMIGLPVLYVSTLSVTVATNVAVVCVLCAFGVREIYNLARTSLMARETAILIIGAAPLALTYVLSTIANNDYSFDAMKTIVQLWLVVLFFSRCVSAKYMRLSGFKWSAPLVSLLVFLPVAIAFIYKAKVLGYDGPESIWTRTKNTIAVVSMLLAVLNYLVWRTAPRRSAAWFFALTACVGMLSCVYFSDSRGTELSLITMIIVGIAWPQVRHKWIFLCGIFVIIPVVIEFYIVLPSLSGSDAFSAAVRSITDQNLYSGRQLIWPSIIDAVSRHSLWLGLGPSATAEQAMLLHGIHKNWSAHDLYLQVLLQGGVIGIASLIFFLSSVWRVLRSIGRRTGRDRMACAFFLGMLCYEVFEVTLLQNNLSTGLALWIGLALVLKVTLSPHMTAHTSAVEYACVQRVMATPQS